MVCKWLGRLTDALCCVRVRSYAALTRVLSAAFWTDCGTATLLWATKAHSLLLTPCTSL